MHPPRHLVRILAVALVAGCSQPTGQFQAAGGSSSPGDPAAETALSGDPSVAAYQTSLYPIVREHCIQCHQSIVSPSFAADDPQAAHDSLVNQGKVNFSNPESSRLVSRLKSDRHNCWGDCDENGEAVLAAIRQWSAARAASGGANDTSVALVKTAALAIPAPLPVTGAVLNFDLSNVATPATPGLKLRLTISKFDDFSYKIDRPVLLTGSTAAISVYVKNVNVLLNDENAPQNSTYRAVDKIVGVNTAGGEISPASMIAESRDFATDKIVIGFEALQSGSSAGPLLASQRFRGARDVIQTSCITCHGAGVTGVPSLAGLVTEDDFKALTWQGQPFVIPGNSAGSLFYQVLQGPTSATIPNLMPKNSDANRRRPLISTVKAWIDELQ